MNVERSGPKRPRLFLPKAMLSAGDGEPRSPTLTGPELRRIVAERVG